MKNNHSFSAIVIAFALAVFTIGWKNAPTKDADIADTVQGIQTGGVKMIPIT